MKITWMLILLTLNSIAVAEQASIFKEPIEDGVYIIDGDIPVLNLEDRHIALQKNNNTKLIVNELLSTLLDVWPQATQSQLTYCISDKFKQNKERVIQAMNQATLDWSEHANVKFIYVEEQDFNCNQRNELVQFDIRPINVFGTYLARAFFPNTPRKQRNIMIDRSAFRANDTAFTGFLRHELGHTLGFRHEHISDEAINSCKVREDKSFKAVTIYDSKSVMHYPHCNGEGDIENLVLTEVDKEGASIVYPY